MAEPWDALPPHDAEAEVGVLGAMLLDAPELADIAGELARAEDFYVPKHATIFTAALSLGKALDIITLRDALDRAGHLERVGGIEYLRSIVERTPGSGNFERYCRIVREKASQRGTLELGQKLLACGGDRQQALRLIEQYAPIMQGRSDEFLKTTSFGEIAHEIAEEAKTAKSRNLVGLPTGVCGGKFDDLVEGIQPGRLWTLAATPGAGKSTLATAIMQGLATRCPDAGVSLLLSTEMEARAVVAGRLALAAGVGARALLKNALTPGQLQRVDGVSGNAAYARMRLAYAHGWLVSDVRACALEHKRAHGLPLLIVDMVSDLRLEGDGEMEQLTGAVRGLKAIAMELQCCVLACAHPRKTQAGTKEHRPTMDDIRGSAEFAQKSDRVLILHRRTEGGFAPREITELIQRKDRQFGDLRTLRMEWNNLTGEYKEVPREDD